MTITVIAVAAESYGALTVLKELYGEAVTHKEHRWKFILSAHHVEPVDNVEVIVQPQVKKSWIVRLFWELFRAKRVVAMTRADVILSLQNMLVFGCPKPQMLYLHNVIPFQNVKRFSLLKREERYYAVYQHLIGRLIKFSVKSADVVVVQSFWLKDVLLNKLRKGREQSVIVAPTEINTQGMVSVDMPDNIRLSIRRFIYPAAPSLFKNHRCLIEAVKILRERNYRNFSVDMTLNDNEIEKTEECINTIGFIPRNKLLQKYKEYALVFPSYIESYGLPLAEARAVGAVILAADCAYAREVLSEYPNALFFNPFKPEELAQQMAKVLDGQIIYRHDEQPKTSGGTWGQIINTISTMRKQVQ